MEIHTNKKITYSYTSYTYLFTPIYPIPILFYAYLPHRHLYTIKYSYIIKNQKRKYATNLTGILLKQ